MLAAQVALYCSNRVGALQFSSALCHSTQAFCRWLRPILMKRALLLIPVVVLYVLHQDLWFWRTARPLVFGFIPVGLFYHACYTVVTAAVLWLLVKYAWPSHLEETVVVHESASTPTAAERGGER